MSAGGPDTASFRVERLGPTEFHVRGELDASTVPVLEAAIGGELPRTGDLTLDLSGLAFMDSSGLRALLRVGRRLQGELLIRAPQPGVARALWLAGFGGRPQLGLRVEGGTPEEAPESGSDFLRSDS